MVVRGRGRSKRHGSRVLKQTWRRRKMMRRRSIRRRRSGRSKLVKENS